jgi:hypothetical protein
MTIEIPDELAKQLEPKREHLAEIIRRGLTKPPAASGLAVEELILFLASKPSPEEIIAFRPSEKSQERLRELLDTNREGSLTGEEEAELDSLEQLDLVFALIKVAARRKLAAAA